MGREKRALRVAFCHPDLGLGGAERLVVDAATELSTKGHEVGIVHLLKLIVDSAQRHP